MKLRTELKVKNELKINPFDGSVFLGSCFSDNIGSRFLELGFPTLVNPFGVIFHPEPLAQILDHAAQEDFRYNSSHLLEFKGRHFSLFHHGSFSSKNAEELLNRMNQSIENLRIRLSNSKLLCLTLGTAWGYTYEDSVVANCHKLPQKIFKKTLSSPPAVVETLTDAIRNLRNAFPQLKVILTVSPVRHVKDGLVENSRSKANLISAVHEVCDRLNEVVYFPAYECVMDDLRDYRFYASDLIHPSTMAVDYVYSKFKTFAFMEDEVFMDLEKFRVLKNHRVLSKEESEISTHKELLLRKKEGLLVKYPNLELD